MYEVTFECRCSWEESYERPTVNQVNGVRATIEIEHSRQWIYLDRRHRVLEYFAPPTSIPMILNIDFVPNGWRTLSATFGRCTTF